jgi:hypothetical protein
MRDRDVRRALHAKVLADHHGDPDTLVLDELALWYGVARVDVAVVNGRLHGYEIKSDCDTLDRLPDQVAIYNRVLDRVTLVVGQRHAAHAIALVPQWWGIKVASMGVRGAVHFVDGRAPRTNPAVEPAAVAALLWCEELIEELDQLGAARGMRGRPRDAMSRRLAELLTPRELRATVRARLKRRSSWRSAAPRT